jgi:hypothetical protein
MLAKILSLCFGALAMVGLLVTPATKDCRAQGRLNPETHKYELLCPTQVVCDDGGQCAPESVPDLNEDGTGFVYFDCVCPDALPEPVACSASAAYYYYLVDGVMKRAIVWECRNADLCVPPPGDLVCGRINATGWLSVPFYLCFCP